ncbi:hypothetical protein GGF31_006113 [Allomyces arbusculus]|nr:hypothetical protein GGF31_006113 [Allomyces arbusculus]
MAMFLKDSSSLTCWQGQLGWVAQGRERMTQKYSVVVLLKVVLDMMHRHYLVTPLKIMDCMDALLKYIYTLALQEYDGMQGVQGM